MTRERIVCSYSIFSSDLSTFSGCGVTLLAPTLLAVKWNMCQEPKLKNMALPTCRAITRLYYALTAGQIFHSTRRAIRASSLYSKVGGGHDSLMPLSLYIIVSVSVP